MAKRPDQIDVLEAEFVVSWPKWKRGELEPLPQACFAGRSNVGKSSLLNCLANRKALARTSNTPGRTQALNVFRVSLRQAGEVRALHFVDLPGYGYAKAPKAVREQWRPMMESYLRENELLRAAFVLFDIRHEPNNNDLDMLETLGEWEIPLIPVATKSDKVGSTQRARHLKAIEQATGIERADIRPFSAVTREGRDELLEELFELAE